MHGLMQVSSPQFLVLSCIHCLDYLFQSSCNKPIFCKAHSWDCKTIDQESMKDLENAWLGPVGFLPKFFAPSIVFPSGL